MNSKTILMANSYGGSIDFVPNSFQNVESKELIAIRALSNADEVYDDIGRVSNGEFKFSGFEKKLN